MRAPASFAFAFGVTLLALACGSAETTSAPPGGEHGALFGDDGESSGTDEATCAATAIQATGAKVDVVFVIDNSGSMTNEMEQIKANINTFAQSIGAVGLDLRVIFIATRAASPTATGNSICVPPPLGGPNCADNPPNFFHISQKVSSTNSLRLILSTYDSTDPALAWNAHVRVDSTKVFVEVTDDRSALPYEEFDAALLAKTPAGTFGTAQSRKYIFHSIVSKPTSEAPPSTAVCPTAAGQSVDYQELSLLTGGIIDEVCKTDYSGVLENLAKNVVDKLSCQLSYPTGDSADPAKLVVRLTPAGAASADLTQVTDSSKCGEVSDGWYYDDPAAPERIVLCPDTCDRANAESGATVEALVGCKAPAPR
jgi:hypothetical protein